MKGKLALAPIQAAFWLMCSLILSCSSSGVNKSVEANTKTAYVFYYAAEKNIERGNFQSAIANLDSAILHNPDFANFYLVKGWVWEQLEQPDSAVAAYEKCLKSRSSYPEVWMRLGRLYHDEQDYGSSVFYYKKAVQQYPDSARIHLMLGELYYRLEKYTLALDYLRSYRKLMPEPAPAYWKWLGYTYYQTREYKKAIPPLTSYTSAVTDDGHAYKILGFSKFKAGEYDQAISDLNSAANILPKDAEIYLYRAKYFLIYHKPKIAREQLQIALSFDSLNTDILYELAVIEYQNGEYNSSKELLSTVIRLNPAYWKAYRYLGFLAELNNEPLKAQKYLTLYLDNTAEEDAEVLRRLEAIQSPPQKQ